MAKFIKLKHTPIKEMIYTISFKENVDVDKLNKFKSLNEISSIFPISATGFNASVQTVNQQAPNAKVLPDGFILRSGNPHTKLLQARRGSFSFHKVNGYESFEILNKELESYWNLLIQCCGKLTVNMLTVRYLNFIELGQDDNINELITITTKHPFGEKSNSFTSFRFNYDKNPAITATVVATIGKNDTKDGIILDILLNKTVRSNENEKFDFANFIDMREAKNEIFFKCITEKTLNRFNQ